MMREGLEGYDGEGRLTLQVAAQIIERISSGLYRSPESAIKELVSNAFDADASQVRIQLYFDYKVGGTARLAKLCVRDSGAGMDVKTLKYVFTHIGGSRKEPDNGEADPLTPGGRPMIGRLGIGMLSIASACQKFFVRTKKKGENREYLAEVDLSYLREKAKRTQSMDVFTIGNVGLFSRSVTNGYDQYTEVEISEFTPPFMESIQNRLGDSFVFQNGKVIDIDEDSLDDTLFEDYFKKLMDWTIRGGELKYGKTKTNPGKLRAAHNLDAAVLNIGLMAPIEYLSDGPVRSKVTKNGIDYEIPGTDNPVYREIKERYKKYNFTVYFEVYKQDAGENEPKISSRFKVYKPIRYPSDWDLEIYEFDELQPELHVVNPLKATIPIDDVINVETLLSGYFYHQHKKILPHEFRGILYRVYNVAIGNRFFDDLKLYATSSIMLWQSLCEIYLDKGFQRIVNLDRESLYEGNNVYRHLNYFLENFLSGNMPERLELGVDDLTSSVERKFFEVEKGILKENTGLINLIKKGRTKRKIAEKEEPWDNFKEELLSNMDCDELIINRSDDISAIYVGKSGNKLEVTLPYLQGDKMWDAIFMNVYLRLNKNSGQEKTKIFAGLLDIFRQWEG